MELWSFWLPGALITLSVAALIALAFLRGARERAGAAGPRAVSVYSAQLREIERDVSRGLVPAAEAERLRTEIARRLLEADRQQPEVEARAPVSARWLGLALVPLTVAAAIMLYTREGAPLYPGQPLVQRHAEAIEARAARPSQAELEAEWLASPDRRPGPKPEADFATLMERLREALAGRPQDLQGHQLLASNEAMLGNHAAAAAAQRRVIELLGDAVTLADRVMMLELLVRAAGGVVSAEAERVIETILRVDPRNGPARYYTGLMLAQTGRPDLTFSLWRALLEDSTADAPWVPHLRATLEELALVAGVRYTLPPAAAQAARGPSGDDIAAAAELSEDERAAMIGGMVEGLAARLARQGGSAEEWARLIGALGVMGQIDRARAIWAEARLVFADRPDDLAVVAEAARGLGME